MRKLLIMLAMLAITPSIALADEIIDSKGNITQCKIITVAEGFIEYQKDGCTYKFARSTQNSVFHDYVDVRTKMGKKEVVERMTGTVIFKDFGGVKFKTESGMVDIPWWRVKFIGIYKT